MDVSNEEHTKSFTYGLIIPSNCGTPMDVSNEEHTKSFTYGLIIPSNCGTPMDVSNEDFEVSKNLEAKVGGELKQPLKEVSSMLGLPHLDGTNMKQVEVEEEMLPSKDELIEDDSQIQEEKKNEVEGSMIELVELQEIELNKVDTGKPFMSEEVFKSEEAAVLWLTNIGRTVGVVLVRARSDYSQGRNPYVKYTCERSGQHRNTRKGYAKKTIGKGKGKPRASSTKKCGCEFQILLKKDRNVDGWRVTVKNGFHNHSLNRSTLGHSYLERLREDEKELLCRLSKSGAKPKVIQQELKDLNPNNCTSAQTIYNERVKLKKAMRGYRTMIQEVLHHAHNSTAFIRYTQANDVVENLFWAHQDSILLANNFPHVLMMDCTYKTSYDEFSMLHIVGVTSTNMTFSIAFACLGAEKIENYQWALLQLRDALSSNTPADTIVTEREMALMDAVRTVYPEAINLLCRCHIEEAVRAKVRPGLTEVECDMKVSEWMKIVYSESEETYLHAVEECKNIFSVDLFNYLEATWLSDHKERFVSAWTDNVFHLGNTQIRRVEGAHAALKNWLGTTNCHVSTGWNEVASLCEQQKHNIVASFEISRVNWPVHLYGERWCCYLRGFMSLHGLNLVNVEMDRAKLVGLDVVKCGCVIRRTHGLPCAHEISIILQDRASLPRTCVHNHWKTLSMDSLLKDEIIDPSPHIDDFLQVFNASTVTQQLELIQRLKKVTKPGATS